MRIDLEWKGCGVTQAFLDVKTLRVEREGTKYEYRFAKSATNNSQLSTNNSGPSEVVSC